MNPFSLPTEDVFLMREKERKFKVEEQERQKGLKIWEKSPTKSSTGVVRTSRLDRNQKNGAKQDRMFQGHVYTSLSLAEHE